MIIKMIKDYIKFEKALNSLKKIKPKQLGILKLHLVPFEFYQDNFRVYLDKYEGQKELRKEWLKLNRDYWKIVSDELEKLKRDKKKRTFKNLFVNEYKGWDGSDGSCTFTDLNEKESNPCQHFTDRFKRRM